MAERLQKVLARSGVASRRQSEELIRAGRVQVNGIVVTEMGTCVDPAVDRIIVDGRPLTRQAAPVYIMLHKPHGYLSTARDERGRRTVLDLLPPGERIYPVGRLDLESEGLILLTNDGEMTHVLTHPRYEHEKEYRVLMQGQPSAEALRCLHQGVALEDGLARVDEVELLEEGVSSWLRLVVHEGRKHLIRRLCAAIGHPVLRLIRTRIGPLRLGALPVGQHRPLTSNEVDSLRRSLQRSTVGGQPG